MNKRNLSRQLCLVLCLVVFLLAFTGCMPAETNAMVWVDAETHEILDVAADAVQTEKDEDGKDKMDARTGEKLYYVENEDGLHRSVFQIIDTSDASKYPDEVKLGLLDYIKLPFSYLLSFLYSMTGSYGLALILFAIIVKIILFPTSAKSKKSMMKMSRLTPKQKALEEKYGDDRQAYQAALQQLYREEGAGGCGGCLWSILPMLLLIPLFYIIREPITWLMFHGDVSPKAVAEIQNIFIIAKHDAANGLAIGKLNTAGFYWQVEALPYISQLKGELAAISTSIETMNTRFLGVELAAIPHLAFWKYFEVNGVWNSIGQFLLPVLSGGVSMLTMWIGQKMNSTVIVDEKGEQDAEMAKKSQQNNMTMMLMMPLFSVYIGFVAPAGLSLYWFLQGLLGMIQDVFLTKRYKKIYDAEDAVKQAKAAEQAAIEAERERIRALRRVENPDGMVGSASKKKLQQREKNEQAAKEAAYLAQKNAQNGAEGEQGARSVRPGDDRPFRRGRNFDPNRYKNNKE